MTPIEIFEHKRRWMMENNFSVTISEDADFDSKQWCKQNLQQHQWQFIRYTDVYEHTMAFEHERDMIRFEEYLRGKYAR